MRISIVVCISAFIALVWLLRREKASIGLPIAYLANLLVLHVPGAIAQVLDKTGTTLTPMRYTRTGIILTAIGSVAFVAGVMFARLGGTSVEPQPAVRTTFWQYSALGGGICTVAGYLIRIPSISAVLVSGGPIWMLGVILALRSTTARGERARAMRWFAVLAAYPILMLLLGGFLSYGSMAVIIVLSGLIVTARSSMRIAVWSVVFLAVGSSLFLSYFEHRPEIRAAVWGGGDTDARIDATMAAIKDVKPFNPGDAAQLYALDQRLNQNYFTGLAASRIKAHEVDYLYGRSVWEGLQALVPRALWPDKPVVSGSPKIVSEMTGLTLGYGTSFGVGNVMEFDINFGIPGVIVGFILLGLVIGRLDLRAAQCDAVGNFGRIFSPFLMAVALIQPNGSIVELASAAVSAAFAAIAWKWVWDRWPKRVLSTRPPVARQPQPLPS